MTFRFTEDWFERAACRGMAVEAERSLFFSTEEEHTPTEEKKQLQKICFGECQARLDCLDYALHHDIWDGIWGGLTPNDRKRARRRPRLFVDINDDIVKVADAL